jgi:SAM-dependent methyltransferase
MSDLAHWEESYRSGDIPWDTGRPSSELVRVVADEKITPSPALEVGCGTGTNAVWLAQRGFDVTAVDLSPRALERARERAQKAGVRVRFVAADLLDPPALGGPYSFFFDRGCYHAVRRTDVGRYLRTLEQATASGSVGLVLAGNAREPHDPGPPVVTEEDIRAELGRSFIIEWLRDFRFDEVAGQGVRVLGWSCFLRRS